MRRILSLVYEPQKSIGGAAFTIMGMVLCSRIFGLLRDRLLAARFHPDELGVYFAAFRIPNFMFELLVMGALTASFIPVFSRYLAENKNDDANRIASIILNGSVIFFFIISIPMLLFTRSICQFIAPGFSEQELTLMVYYTRIMVLFQVIPLTFGNFFTGILQSHRYFFVPAAAPVVYNLGIIAGILLFSDSYHLLAPVIGVTFGAFLFVVIHIPIMFRISYRHTWSLDFRESGVKEVMALMIPRTIGLAVTQIDTTVDLILSSILGARMITVFHFAQHLQYLPVGLFGVTIAQAALPSFSEALVKRGKQDFFRMLYATFLQVMFFLLPISVLFIVLRIPIIRLVFGASLFDWEATVLTGKTLSAFSLSLVAQGLIHILVRGYYALYESKTPVAIGIISVMVNAALSIFFVSVLKFEVWALGIATSASSYLQLTLLFILIHVQERHSVPVSLLVAIVKMSVCALVMGVSLYIPLKLMDQLVFDTTRTVGLLLLTSIVSMVGLVVYVLLSWVFNVEAMNSVRSFIFRLKRRFIVYEPVPEIISDGSEVSQSSS